MNLKEEILNYSFIESCDYSDILNKAQQYIHTEIAKSTKSRVLKQNSMKINDLICLIMYCDYTELSRDFSLSFRKLHRFELLEQTKARNAKYCHWSKGLRHVIQHYGQHNNKGGENGILSKLEGPFYCGMSVMLKIPQCKFQIYIKSPISTSTKLPVAVKV